MHPLRKIENLLAGAVFICLSLFLFRQICDYDIWFYLVIGREIVTSGAIPTNEFYVLPVLGESAHFTAWGFGVLVYLVYQTFGYIGLSALNAALGGATFLLLYLASRQGWQQRFAGWLALAMLWCLYWFVEQRMHYRPENVFYVMLAAEILCLEKYCLTGRRLWLFPLPLMSWAMSQIHTTSLLLLCVLGAYFVDRVWLALRHHRQAAMQILPLLIAGVAMLAFGVVNPYGWRHYLTPIFSMQHPYNDTVVEYLPVLRTEYASVFVAAMVLWCVLFTVTRQRRLAYLVLFAAFASLTMRYVRMLPLFAIVIYMPVTRACCDLYQRYLEHRARCLQAGILLVITGFGMTATWSTSPLSMMGQGVSTDMFPLQGIERIRDLQPAGNLFNAFETGGYLAWRLDRRYNIFIDGHFLFFNKAWTEYVAIAKGDMALLDKYEIGTIVMPATMQFSGELFPLIDRLAQDDNWQLLSREREGMVFLHRTRSKIDITGLDKKHIWEQVLFEATVTAQTYPEHADAYYALSIACDRLGDKAAAKRYYAIYRHYKQRQ